MSAPETLPKPERIRSERRIDTLFKGGRRGNVHPVKYCWVATATANYVEGTGVPGEAPLAKEAGITGMADAPVAVMFSVPKKMFKRAWKRNLIKRRLRESYRRRKHALVAVAAAAGRRIDIAFICSPETIGTGTAEIPDFKTIDNAVAKILEQIMARS